MSEQAASPLFSCYDYDSPEHNWLNCDECQKYYNDYLLIEQTTPQELLPRLKYCMDIPGLVSEESLAYLFQLAMTAKTSPVSGGWMLELGTFRGRSASVLGEVAKSQKMTVVTVDNFRMRHHGENTAALARMQLSELPVAVIKGNTTDYIPTRPKGSLWLLFIDSHHAPETLSKELERFVPYLADDGVVAMHDFGRSEYPGYTEAAIKYFMHPDSDWYCHGVVDTLAGFTRRRTLESEA